MKIIFESPEERANYTSRYGKWDVGIIYITKFKEVELPTLYTPRHTTAEVYSDKKDLQEIIRDFKHRICWDWLENAPLIHFPEKEPEHLNYIGVRQVGTKSHPVWKLIAKMYIDPQQGQFLIPLSNVEESFIREIAKCLHETRLSGIIEQFTERDDDVIIADKPQLFCLFHGIVVELERRQRMLNEGADHKSLSFLILESLLKRLDGVLR